MANANVPTYNPGERWPAECERLTARQRMHFSSPIPPAKQKVLPLHSRGRAVLK
ncbi:hypothetical protein RISK_005937 [Rhodopirellula islandica]|uniref:Uncharacterized protein n=1 Tax=Rhodopirellula islandica TaxID=595434 RepID=A0A0J1B6K7_RHOIS|nr:hypothetical protein RISK_005937 [Rhodopirellula islandica]